MKIVKDKNGTRLLYYRRKDTEPVAYAESGDECWTATAYRVSLDGPRVNFDAVPATKEAAQEAIRSGKIRMTRQALESEATRRVARTARRICSRCSKRAKEREPTGWGYWILGRKHDDDRINFWEADACPDCVDEIDATAAKLITEGWEVCGEMGDSPDQRKA